MSREGWETQVKDAAQEVANMQWHLDKIKIQFATVVIARIEAALANGHRTVEDLDTNEHYIAVQKSIKALETAEKRLILLAKVPQ